PVPLAELLKASLAQAGLAPITWQQASEPGNPGLNRRISNRLLKQRGFQLNHPRIALLSGDGAPQREPTSTAKPTSPQR
ncbi:MAG: oxidoreductase, partial [Synechococcus sp.]|nr:oxidoreductase [Synechococcus sp.]